MTAPGAGDGEAPQKAMLRFEGPDGWHAIPIPIPPAEATVMDLMPAAREISERTTDMALEHERAQGRQISCRAGCGACCRQLVAISFVEAEALARLVAAMPEERAAVIRGRFAAAVKRLEDVDLLDADDVLGDRTLAATDMGDPALTRRELCRKYFELKIACPFLENESCSIHPERPLVCREYHVTTPAERCARLYEAEIDRVQSPLRLGEVLARTLPKFVSVELGMIPLVLSLEWSAAHGEKLADRHEGKTLLNAMIGELGGR